MLFASNYFSTRQSTAILKMNFKAARKTLSLAGAAFLTGCAITPYENLNLDTTSNFRTPAEGAAGVYVYQWKRGIVGAALDVDFEIKGYPAMPLNTGEYCYLELKPGSYDYKVTGAPFKQYVPVKIEANKNYFFIASLVNFSDYIGIVRDQSEIDAAKKNILSGRYEKCEID